MAHEEHVGRFVWYDLMTSDISAAIDFYNKVVGWTSQPWGEGEHPYQMLMAGESGIGGVMLLPEEAKAMGAPNHWLAYTVVADVDATSAQVTGLGGRVFKEGFDIPEVGRIAILGDPQGAAFAVYTPGERVPDHDRGVAGGVSWHELMTSDYEAGFEFYSKVFGWVKTRDMDMGPAGTYQMFGRPGEESSLGGMMTLPAEVPAPPHWLYYFNVDDIDSALSRVRDSGGQVHNGPMDIPGGGKIAQCLDPQGAGFALYAEAPA